MQQLAWYSENLKEALYLVIVRYCPETKRHHRPSAEVMFTLAPEFDRESQLAAWTELGLANLRSGEVSFLDHAAGPCTTFSLWAGRPQPGYKSGNLDR